MRNLALPYSWATSSLARLGEHLRMPLYRNGYSLMLSSGAGAFLGALYWIVAARLYTPEVLGRNSAAISAMMFLAGVAQLNLLSALIRFLPEAGPKSRGFIAIAYGIAGAASAVAGLVFLWGLGNWAPNLGFLADTPSLAIWFALATVAWSIYSMQDGVLTGLRQATWVPAKNVTFALSKIALLFVFALSLPEYGVFGSWTVALAVILPANWLIFRKLIPMHVQRSKERPVVLDAARVVRYASGDYVGALCWLAATTLLPVIVNDIEGPEAAAYFYVAWQVAMLLLMVGSSMGYSLIVEAAHDDAKLGAYSRRVFVSTIRIVGLGALAVVVAAPLIMHVFGSEYSEGGTTLLRLLALGSVPGVVTLLAVSVARAQRRTRVATANLALLCVLVLGLAYYLMGPFGATGVGLAWLASQTTVAVIAVLTQLRPLWTAHPIPSKARASDLQTDNTEPSWRIIGQCASASTDDE